MNQNEIIFVIGLIIVVVILAVFFAYTMGLFDPKTKWYKVDTITRSYYDIPGVKPCNKCGQEKCDIIMDIDINAVGIYKKEVRFKKHIEPMFHIECPKCGCRSKEDRILKEVILAWNMDSRFQIEENNNG